MNPKERGKSLWKDYLTDGQKVPLSVIWMRSGFTFSHDIIMQNTCHELTLKKRELIE
jgi:hypothetical protein